MSKFKVKSCLKAMRPKAVSFLITAMLVVSLNATAAPKDPPVIGVSVANMSHEYIARVWRSIDATLKMLGVKEVALDARWDINAQANHIDQFILQKVDCALIQPVGPAASVYIKRLNEAHIPVVTFLDSFAGGPDAAGYRSYVGSDFMDGAGAGLSGDYLAGTLLHGSGTVVYIMGEEGVGVTRTRDKGFKDALKKYPGVKIIFEQNGKWDRDSGLKLMSDALQKFPTRGSISAVFAHNDSMALGAMRALQEAGRLNEVVIAAVDGVPEALDAIQKGQMAATAYQNAEVMGRYAAIVSYQAALQLPVKQAPIQYNIPWVLITKENAQKIGSMQDVMKTADEFVVQNAPIIQQK